MVLVRDVDLSQGHLVSLGQGDRLQALLSDIVEGVLSGLLDLVDIEDDWFVGVGRCAILRLVKLLGFSLD